MVTDETRFLSYARGKDPSVLEELLRNHAQGAYQQAVRLLGNPADADDAVQEAFLQTVRTASRYQPSVPFRAWLGHLVHHAALRVRRASSRRERRHRRAGQVAQAASDAPPADDVAEAVRLAVAALPETYRAAIDLHYFGGLNQIDTAKALGLSQNAVAVRIHRGRERLRRALDRRQPLPMEAVVAALTTAPMHTAPATVTAHAVVIATWSAQGTHPMSTIPGSLRAWVRHPLRTALVAATMAVAALVALAAWKQHTIHPVPREHHALAAQLQPDQLSAGVATATSAGTSAPIWWKGSAGDLLPWIDPKAMLTLGIDWEALRTAGAWAPPTSLLADPRLADTLQRIRHTLELWSLGSIEVPQLLSWWDQATGFVQSVRIDGAADHTEENALMVADLGAASSSLQSYLTTMLRMPTKAPGGLQPSSSGYAPTQIGSFVGQSRLGTVVAFAGQRSALGSEHLLRQLVTNPTQPLPAWRAAPLWLQFDATRLLAVLPMQLPILDQLLPSWHDSRPHLAIAMTPTPDGWTATTTLSGLPQPRLGKLGPVASGVLSSAGLAGIAIAAASSQDLAVIARQLMAGLGWSAEDGSMGVRSPIGNLLLHCTGELALSIDPGSPLPNISLVVPLRADALREDVVAALTTVLTAAGGTPISTSQTDTKTWSCPTPLGPGLCLLAADRIVLTTAMTVSPRLASGTGAALPCAIAARADMALIGRTYLPLLEALVPARPYYLPSQTVLEQLPLLTNDATSYILDAMHGKSSPSFGAYVTAPRSTSWQTLSTPSLTLFGSADVARTLDDCLAIFSDALPSGDWNLAHHAVLYRRADGWHELPMVTYTATGPNTFQAFSPSYQEWMTPAMSLERARHRTSGLRQLAGPALSDLQLLPIPELASIDRGWLPDVRVCCEHLRQWRLSVTAVADGCIIDEQGEPLVAASMLLVPPLLLMTHGRPPVAHHPPSPPPVQQPPPQPGF
jgi:RNA polymerase sigma factor (sigma-70 family)